MIVILDFGSQYSELIARRVRESNVYSEVILHDTPCDVILEKYQPRALFYLVDHRLHTIRMHLRVTQNYLTWAFQF